MQSQKSAKYNPVFDTNTYNSDAPSILAPPYFEHPLDRWKLALLIPLFLLLLAGAVYRQRSWASWIPQPPANSVANTVDNSPPTDLQVTSSSQTINDASLSAESQSDKSLIEGIAVQTGELQDSAVQGTEVQIGVQAGGASSDSTEQPRTREFNTIQPLPLYFEKGQAPIMPVTLSRPAQGQFISQNEASIFSGTAAAGSKVIVNHGQSTGRRADGLTVYQTGTIGEVQAGADGRWQIGISTPLPPGEHQLSVTQIDAQNGMQTTFTPVSFAVLGAGESVKAGLIPMINSPQTASRLSASCNGSSGQRFSGTAMPGWIIQLLINEQPAGKTRVGINQAWEVTIAQPLTAGSYIARTVLLSPGGEVAAESSPVAFAMYACQ